MIAVLSKYSGLPFGDFSPFRILMDFGYDFDFNYISNYRLHHFEGIWFVVIPIFFTQLGIKLQERLVEGPAIILF